MRALKALVALAMLAATLLAVPATGAGANGGSDEVDVIRRANGILDIIGDNGDNDVAICQTPELPTDAAADGHGYDYVVVIEDDDGIHYVYVENITKDVRFNMRGGDDRIRINGGGGDCERFVEPDADVAADGHRTIHFPRDLRIVLGSGEDSVFGYDLWVGDDIAVIGGSGFDDTEFVHSYVEDRVDVIAGPGGSVTTLARFSHGATSVRGGPQEDLIFLFDGELGRAPRFLTASGSDGLISEDVGADGRVLANMGAGDDYLNWSDHGGPSCDGPDCCEIEECCGEAGCDEHEEEQDFYFNIIMGSGDDETHMNIPLIPQDRLNGGSGNGDYLGFIEPLDVNAELFGGATINGYEFFGEPDSPVLQ